MGERASNPCANYHFKHWIELSLFQMSTEKPLETLYD